MSEIKIVVLGPGGVGKSALVGRYVQGVFIETYDPTIEDSYRKQVEIKGKDFMVEITDTAGTEQFVSMRDLYIKLGDSFLVIYAINSKNSFVELDKIHKQIMDVKSGKEKIPILLIGNKSDLEDERVISKKEAEELAAKWGVEYLETSARDNNNVEEAFMKAITSFLLLNPKKIKGGKKCIIA